MLSNYAMDSGWYYSRPGEVPGQQGPVSWADLVALARTGALLPADMVWHPALPGWLPAAEVTGLFLAHPSPVARQPAADGWFSRFGWVLPLATLVVVGLILALIFALRDGDDDRSTQTISPTGTSGVATTAPPVTAPPAEPDSWLVMIYAAADDEILEEDMVYDLNEAELVGSTEHVTVVAQLDRYTGGFAGSGDVTTTKRYLVTQDQDLYTVNSRELDDLGEKDMGDPQTLYDFATWAITSYPAENYVLILGDHGGGWTGGWTDDDPQTGSALSLHEIDVALGEIVADTGIGALELVGFDACLMGQLEVMNAVAPHARYCVASEEVEPSIGWGYAGFLRALAEDPTMSGRQLAEAIVDSYIRQDVRVTDEEARRRLTGGDYPDHAVIAELSKDTTLAGIDLSAIQALDKALNELAVALTNINQRKVARARAYAQSFASVFGEEQPPSFIDLGHFADLLAASTDDVHVLEAVAQIKSLLSQAVVSESHGEGRPAASGLSIYFPSSQEYAGTFGQWEANYALSAGRFVTAALWDDYLTYHYTGRPFDPASADLSVVTPPRSGLTDFAEAAKRSAPTPDSKIDAPGAGRVTIAPISTSTSVLSADEVATLSTTVTGNNIAYIYYYVGYFWEEDGSFLSADAGFIEPGQTKEIGGVYYPDWGESGTAAVEFDWEPTLYFMSDGDPDHDQFAFFMPSVYGADQAGDVYSVRGTYTFEDTGTQVEAKINFSGEGDMLSVWGFFSSESESGAGAWYEINPVAGDTFTITHEYLEFSDDPEGEFVDYSGGTMVFGEKPFTMVPYYAVPGDYVLGVGVEDLDGNLTWEFVDLKVTK